MPPVVEVPHDDVYFAPIETAREKIRHDPNTREFHGSDRERLETPGLKSLKSVTTRGGTELSTEEAPEIRPYPMDLATAEGTGRNWHDAKHAHVRHVKHGDENYLLRSKLSNGTGFWPAADSFFVNGEWEKDEPKGEGENGRGGDGAKGDGGKGEPAKDEEKKGK